MIVSLKKYNNINTLINWLLVAYALCIPISRAGIVFFTGLLFLLWIYEGNFTKKINQLKSQKIVLVLTLFIMYSFIGVFWADYNKIEGLDYAIKYWYFLPILVLATSLKEKYLKYIFSAFLAGIFISEILSYGIFFEWWTWRNVSPSDPTPFMNHLQYSMFLTIASLLLLNKLFDVSETSKVKFFYFLFFLTATVNLFMNGGRTGQMAFIITIFIVFIINFKSKIKATFISLLLVIGILFIAYKTSPIFESRINKSIISLKKLSENNNYCTSFGVRVGMWIVGSEIFIENPLFGVGTSDETPVLIEKILEKHPDKKCAINLPNFHNDFIQILVQLGLIGAVMYIMIFYFLFKLKIKDKVFKNMLIIFTSVYLVSSQFENMLHQQFSMAIFALFVGVFIAKNRIENEI